ncbi:MAG: hypothetical protein JST10_10065 [Bacteroidetes bacterium]|nr:hypothetical protein [Bacteroidota bacterium]
MKKFISLVLMVTGISSIMFAQSEKYITAMEKNLALYDSAKTVEDFTKVANNFERIGDAEKTQWLPYYYSGLALSTAGWFPELTNKDANAEKMNTLCDKADALVTSDQDKAEILALRNISATQQMLVNPAGRYMSYGQAASQALEKGLQLSPDNPRLYYLKGMGVFNTPEQFGGGKDKAKPIFEKALELFKQQQPKQLDPKWGQKQVEDMISKCQ